MYRAEGRVVEKTNEGDNGGNLVIMGEAVKKALSSLPRRREGWRKGEALLDVEIPIERKSRRVQVKGVVDLCRITLYVACVAHEARQKLVDVADPPERLRPSASRAMGLRLELTGSD
jgi:hypothetical protein